MSVFTFLMHSCKVGNYCSFLHQGSATGTLPENDRCEFECTILCVESIYGGQRSRRKLETGLEGLLVLSLAAPDSPTQKHLL